ncbi:MAG: alkylhydroperoxidase [Robiginitomaculum sp.]|nr:MAG: alkylhydroperoxidase [Robiginitomaculum sp.]
MNADYKTNLALITNEAATGEAKTIFEATKTQLGFVPNMYQIMANSQGYLSTYIHGYKAFRQASGFTPQEQELVFLVISDKNGCEYCTAAHSMIADKVAKFDADTLANVRAGNPVSDPKLQALAVMTSRLFDTRGLITKMDAQNFLSAGYAEEQILEIILAISVKTLSNYANHIFHTDVDAAFKDYAVKT